MDKVIIGIVTKYDETQEGRPEGLIRNEIKNAIIANGGIAIGILPTFEELDFMPLGENNLDFSYLTPQNKKDLIQQIKLCDGIILQGGKTSNKYEAWIAKYTYDHDIPTLSICAGQNMAIRAVGGTTKKICNPEKHYQQNADYVHDIFIDKNSDFYKIVKTDKMKVNSRHIRTINDPTKYYRVAAVCDDGYYDVLEAVGKKFNLAVRFHPESLYHMDKKHNAIFQAFIKASKENKNK